LSTRQNSTLAADSPVDLYWIGRPAHTDEHISKGDTDIKICDAFWDDFLIAAKAVYHLDREADLFDAFNFVREKFLGGWTMIEDSPFIKNIDDQIEREYRKETRNGKWKTINPQTQILK
jgi:hypothetical protein